MTSYVELPRQITTAITANAALVAGRHTPVDATSVSITVTLPASATPGATLSVEKIDSSTHTVTVSGTIRGSVTTTVLSLQHSSITFTADASGSSWVPTAGRVSETSLAGTIAKAADTSVALVTAFGAIGDAKVQNTGAITSGAAVLTLGSSQFTAADVGKTILVTGAGAAGAALTTTIAGYTSGTQVTLAANASATISATKVVWGTDDSAAIQAAHDSLPTRGGTVLFPPRGYLVKTGIVSNRNSVKFEGNGGIGYRISTDNLTYGGGATLHAVTAGMTVLALNNQATTIVFGQTVNRLNFIDETGKTATLLSLQNTNHPRVQNSAFQFAAIALNVHRTVDANMDSSWADLVDNLFAHNAIGVDVSGSAGTPSIHVGGGTFLVPASGIGISHDTNAFYNRYEHMKFDIGSGGVGIWMKSGRRNTIVAPHMEINGGTGIQIGGVSSSSAPNGVAIIAPVIVDDAASPYTITGIAVGLSDTTTGNVSGVTIVAPDITASIAIRFGSKSVGNTVTGGVGVFSPTWVQIDAGAVGTGIVGGVTEPGSSFGAIVDNGTGSWRIGYMGGGTAPEGIILAGGNGSPEGVVTAPVGAIYPRRDGSAGTSLYVKESGTGNTGWVAHLSASGASTLDRRLVNARVASTGIQAETFPRWSMNGGSSMVAGTVYASRISLVAGSYSTVSFQVGVAGSSDIANWYIGLYNATTNALVASTSALASSLETTTGMKTTTLAYTVPADGDYYMAILVGSATTVPQMCALSAAANSGALVLAPAIATAHATLSQTALPSPMTPMTTVNASGLKAFWYRYE